MTNAELTKLIRESVRKELVKEQSAPIEDFGIVMDKVQDSLSDVKTRLDDEIHSMTSKRDYVNVMIRALNHSDFGGTDNDNINPHTALARGIDKLAPTFRRFGFERR